MSGDAEHDTKPPPLDPRLALYAGRAVMACGLFLAVAAGRPRHRPLVPQLVPAAGLLALLLLAAAVGVAYAGRRQVGLVWCSVAALLALPLHAVYSNTALPELAREGGVEGVAELIVRAAALAALGTWVALERRWGVFHRP